MVAVEATVGHRSPTQKPEGGPQGVGPAEQMRSLDLDPGRESILSTSQMAQHQHRGQTRLVPSRSCLPMEGAEAPDLPLKQWQQAAWWPRLDQGRQAFGRLNRPANWRHPRESNAASAGNRLGSKTEQNAAFECGLALKSLAKYL